MADIVLTAHRPARFVLPRLDPWAWAMVAVTLAASAIIVMPPAVVLLLSFREGRPIDPHQAYSLGHYVAVFGDPFIYGVLANTLGVALITLAVALAFGVPAAWLVERSDLKAKPVVLTMMTIGLLVPGFATAMGWLFLMHPRIGLVNALAIQALGLRAAPFNIASLFGMGWVQGLNLAPIGFIMTASVLRAIDPSLEESAQMSGAGFAAILRRVTLPLAWPGILAAGIYVFTIGFAAFDVPAIIGWSNKIFTFSTFLVNELAPADGLPAYGPAAALSTVMIALAGGLSWWYGRLQREAHRYQVVTGKAYRPRLIALGKRAVWAWGFLGIYFTLAKLLPLAVLVWASILPYFQLPSADALASVSLVNFQRIPWDLFLAGARNTLLLTAATPTLTLALALAFSWVALRSRFPGRGIFDFIAFLPHAIPNIVFSVGVLLFVLYAVQRIVPLYGTVWLLLSLFVIARLSYATRMTNGTLLQLHRDLEEAATMSGGATGTVMRRVLLPLLTPTLIYAWLWTALLTFRELTLAVLLTTRDNLTLPVVVWSIWQDGGFGKAAAITLLLMALMLPLIALYWWAMRRTGLREGA
ncbi:MAG TPA: ABC transporter permease subunit [Stellaceae bacterium]|jgi:iron(III) transport system permease protein|nr:ABC transporter permease subunit [Stellaceae bacterium]